MQYNFESDLNCSEPVMVDNRSSKLLNSTTRSFVNVPGPIAKELRSASATKNQVDKFLRKDSPLEILSLMEDNSSIRGYLKRISMSLDGLIDIRKRISMGEFRSSRGFSNKYTTVKNSNIPQRDVYDDLRATSYQKEKIETEVFHLKKLLAKCEDPTRELALKEKVENGSKTLRKKEDEVRAIRQDLARLSKELSERNGLSGSKTSDNASIGSESSDIRLYKEVQAIAAVLVQTRQKLKKEKEAEEKLFIELERREEKSHEEEVKLYDLKDRVLKRLGNNATSDDVNYLASPRYNRNAKPMTFADTQLRANNNSVMKSPAALGSISTARRRLSNGSQSTTNQNVNSGVKGTNCVAYGKTVDQSKQVDSLDTLVSLERKVTVLNSVVEKMGESLIAAQDSLTSNVMKHQDTIAELNSQLEHEERKAAAIEEEYERLINGLSEKQLLALPTRFQPPHIRTLALKRQQVQQQQAATQLKDQLQNIRNAPPFATNVSVTLKQNSVKTNNSNMLDGDPLPSSRIPSFNRKTNTKKETALKPAVVNKVQATTNISGLREELHTPRDSSRNDYIKSYNVAAGKIDDSFDEDNHFISNNLVSPVIKKEKVVVSSTINDSEIIRSPAAAVAHSKVAASDVFSKSQKSLTSPSVSPLKQVPFVQSESPIKKSIATHGEKHSKEKSFMDEMIIDEVPQTAPKASRRNIHEMSPPFAADEITQNENDSSPYKEKPTIVEKSKLNTVGFKSISPLSVSQQQDQVEAENATIDKGLHNVLPTPGRFQGTDTDFEEHKTNTLVGGDSPDRTGNQAMMLAMLAEEELRNKDATKTHLEYDYDADNNDNGDEINEDEDYHYSRGYENEYVQQQQQNDEVEDFEYHTYKSASKGNSNKHNTFEDSDHDDYADDDDYEDDFDEEE